MCLALLQLSEQSSVLTEGEKAKSALELELARRVALIAKLEEDLASAAMSQRSGRNADGSQSLLPLIPGSPLRTPTPEPGAASLSGEGVLSNVGSASRIAGAGEGASTSSGADGSGSGSESLLGIVVSQRDRFRQRVASLEEEKGEDGLSSQHTAQFLHCGTLVCTHAWD